MKYSKEDGRQVEEFIDWTAKVAEQWDPNDPTGLPNAMHLDSVSFDNYLLKNKFGKTVARIADFITQALLGITSRETSALFMIDYFRSGTGLPNLISERKNGGQYIRTRKGILVLACQS